MAPAKSQALVHRTLPSFFKVTQENARQLPTELVDNSEGRLEKIAGSPELTDDWTSNHILITREFAADGNYETSSLCDSSENQMNLHTTNTETRVHHGNEVEDTQTTSTSKFVEQFSPSTHDMHPKEYTLFELEEVAPDSPIKCPTDSSASSCTVSLNDYLCRLEHFVDFRTSKLKYREAKLDLSVHPNSISELARFYEAYPTSSCFTEVKCEPDFFQSLLCKLIQDSNQDIHELCGGLIKKLFPTSHPTEESILSNMRERISELISLCSERVNYGLNHSLALWRWESRDPMRFPEDILRIVSERQKKRLDFMTRLTDMMNLILKDYPDFDIMDHMSHQKAQIVTGRNEDHFRELKREQKRKIQEQKRLFLETERARKIQEKERIRTDNQRKKEAEREKLIAEKIDKKFRIQKEKTSECSQPSIAAFVQVHRNRENFTADSTSCFDEYFRPFFVKKTMSMAPIPALRDSLPINVCFGQQLSLPTDQGIRRYGSLGIKHLGSYFKLLQFHDSFPRPAFFGVIKHCIPKKATARNPQKKEEELDYDYDSSQEWEDEVGESLSATDTDKDDNEDEDEISETEDWLVPNGHVSEGEGAMTGGISGFSKLELNQSIGKKALVENLVPTCSDIYYSMDPFHDENAKFHYAMLNIPQFRFCQDFLEYSIAFNRGTPVVSTENVSQME